MYIHIHTYIYVVHVCIWLKLMFSAFSHPQHTGSDAASLHQWSWEVTPHLCWTPSRRDLRRGIQSRGKCLPGGASVEWERARVDWNLLQPWGRQRSGLGTLSLSQGGKKGEHCGRSAGPAQGSWTGYLKSAPHTSVLILGRILICSSSHL